MPQPRGHAAPELEPAGLLPDVMATEVVQDVAELLAAVAPVVEDEGECQELAAHPPLTAPHLLRAWSHPFHKTPVFQADNFFRTKGIVSRSSPKTGLGQIRPGLEQPHYFEYHYDRERRYDRNDSNIQPLHSNVYLNITAGCRLAYNKPNLNHTKFTRARLLPFFPLPVASHADLSPFTPIICNSIRAPARSLPLVE